MKRPDEHALQRAFCIFLDGARDTQTGAWRILPALAPGVVYWHTPNGGARGGLEAKRFKEAGVKAGIPDLFFLRAGSLYGMEWKAPGGVLSLAQIEMRSRLTDAGMAASCVVDNLEAAKAFCRLHLLTVCGN